MAVEDDICEVVVHLDGNLNARLLAVAEQLGESQDAVIELAISRELPHLEATVAPNKGVSSYQCEQHHSGVDRVTRSAPTNS